MKAMMNETYMGKAPVFRVRMRETLSDQKAYLRWKRMIDCGLSFALGIVLFLPMVLIGILIKVDSKGSIIFAQERLGENGKPFIMLKFRTMHVDAESDGPRWAEHEDPRCTRLGRFLRKTHLDELPQLWNILKGDMSFVGPRPERAFFYDEFSKYIPNFRDRLCVKPGLTGWAQINGGYDLRPEEKLVYDLEYIEKRTVFFDCVCILRTIRLVFTHEGAR